jgi:hypothetical protein
MGAVMSDKQQIILTGKSYGGKRGDRRTTDADRAAELVAAGLAQYPPTSEAAKKAATS